MTSMQWPAASRAALPPAVPGEFIPRRDHAVRLFWVAVPGMLPVVALRGIDGAGDVARHVAILALVGATVGLAQALVCWRGTVAWKFWLPLTAVGWVTGAVGGTLLGAVAFEGLSALGISLHRATAYQLIALCAGAGAGWNAGSLQGMLLRRQGRAWKWWVYASAGAAAMAALVPLVFFR